MKNKKDRMVFSMRLQDEVNIISRLRFQVVFMKKFVFTRPRDGALAVITWEESKVSQCGRFPMSALFSARFIEAFVSPG